MARTDDNFYYEGFGAPNYTQVPDDFFDILAPQLKESELRVLLYIIRRTFGFKKNSDAISLSQMVNGIKTKDGRVLDHGTGMSRKAVVAGCAGLVTKGIVVADKKKTKKGENETNIYRLRFRGEPSQERGVVTQSNYPSYRSTPPVVTQSNPQETVVQETVKQQNVVANKNPKQKKNNHTLTAAEKNVVVVLTDKKIGVAKNTAQQLVIDNHNKAPEDRVDIELMIDYLNYNLAVHPERVNNPVGWIVTAVSEGYGKPGGYTSDWRTKLEEREAAEKKRQEAIKAREKSQKQQSDDQNQERRQARQNRLDELKAQYQTKDEDARLWEKVTAQIRPRIGETVFNTLFGESDLLRVTDTQASIVVANDFVRSQVEKRYVALVKKLLAVNLGRDIEPQFISLE